jgi:hypothetical protein
MSLFGPATPISTRYNTPGVGYVREELRAFFYHYEVVRDCLGGAVAVKSRKDKYLPRPDAADTSKENILRYNDYLARAIFYGATRRTLGGMLGEVFSRDPVIEIDDRLDFLKTDATGTGVPLVQLSKRAVARVLAYGRGGMFVDFPQTDGAVTKFDLDNGMRPTLMAFNPWEVINWRTDFRGTEEVYTLIVLQEPYIASDDGFEVKTGLQYRVLRLETEKGELDAENGEYSVEIWRKKNPSAAGGAVLTQNKFFPIINGQRSNKIPFSFLGAETNDSAVDYPPLFDLADINIGHYRNSADYEESVWMVGQPTPWVSGLNKNWVEEVFKGKLRLGSRGVIPLPEGAAAGLLQMEPNSGAKEAMEHKERLMVALGAEIVQVKTVQRTATEASQEKASRSSVLSTTADNVSDIITKSIKFAGTWLGIDTSATETDTQYKLNTEFDLTNMTPQQIQAVVSAWQSRAISKTEMRENFRRGGIATQDDAEAADEIADELASDTATEIDKAAQLAAAMDTGNDPGGAA